MQKVNVSTPAPDIACVEAKRELTRAIMGGTFAMRAAGERLLPRHPAEDVNVYKVRLQKTFLDNFVGKAIEQATGKIFSKDICTDTVPAEIEALLDNIDRMGNGFGPFMLDVANIAFRDGISYVMADMPKIEGLLTLADAKARGVRPYAIHIKPDCILEVLSDLINGESTLTRVRIKECLRVPAADWKYSEIEQVRVWHREQTEAGALVRWEVYRENDNKEWILYEEGVTGFKSIYLVPFYTNRSSYMIGEPPFQNTAESNLEHWQTKSEFSHALSMNCFGMFTATGVNHDFGMEVGPAKCLVTTNPDAKFGILETTGVGVTLSATALQAIESRIDSAGVDLRVENAGNVTATAAALDSEETNAALKAIAKGFCESSGLLFKYFGEIMGLSATDTGCACFNDDFGGGTGTPQGLQSLDKARALGDISREGYLCELQRRGELSEDFDPVADAEIQASEGPALSTMVPDKKANQQMQTMD